MSVANSCEESSPSIEEDDDDDDNDDDDDDDDNDDDEPIAKLVSPRSKQEKRKSTKEKVGRHQPTRYHKLRLDCDDEVDNNNNNNTQQPNNNNTQQPNNNKQQRHVVEMNNNNKRTADASTNKNSTKTNSSKKSKTDTNKKKADSTNPPDSLEYKQGRRGKNWTKLESCLLTHAYINASSSSSLSPSSANKNNDAMRGTIRHYQSSDRIWYIVWKNLAELWKQKNDYATDKDTINQRNKETFAERGRDAKSCRTHWRKMISQIRTFHSVYQSLMMTVDDQRQHNKEVVVDESKYEVAEKEYFLNTQGKSGFEKERYQDGRLRFPYRRCWEVLLQRQQFKILATKDKPVNRIHSHVSYSAAAIGTDDADKNGDKESGDEENKNEENVAVTASDVSPSIRLCSTEDDNVPDNEKKLPAIDLTTKKPATYVPKKATVMEGQKRLQQLPSVAKSDERHVKVDTMSQFGQAMLAFTNYLSNQQHHAPQPPPPILNHDANVKEIMPYLPPEMQKELAVTLAQTTIMSLQLRQAEMRLQISQLGHNFSTPSTITEDGQSDSQPGGGGGGGGGGGEERERAAADDDTGDKMTDDNRRENNQV